MMAAALRLLPLAVAGRIADNFGLSAVLNVAVARFHTVPAPRRCVMHLTA
jgi:hypothetical protein